MYPDSVVWQSVLSRHRIQSDNAFCAVLAIFRVFFETVCACRGAVGVCGSCVVRIWREGSVLEPANGGFALNIIVCRIYPNHLPIFIPVSDSLCLVVVSRRGKMPIRIRSRERIIDDVAIKIQRLRIAQFCVWYGLRFRAPVRRQPPSQGTRVIPCPEVVVAGVGGEGRFRVAFLAGEVEFGCAGADALLVDAVAKGQPCPRGQAPARRDLAPPLAPPSPLDRRRRRALVLSRTRSRHAPHNQHTPAVEASVKAARSLRVHRSAAKSLDGRWSGGYSATDADGLYFQQVHAQ